MTVYYLSVIYLLPSSSIMNEGVQSAKGHGQVGKKAERQMELCSEQLSKNIRV